MEIRCDRCGALHPSTIVQSTISRDHKFHRRAYSYFFCEDCYVRWDEMMDDFFEEVKE